MKKLLVILLLLSGLPALAQQPGVERDEEGRLLSSSHGVYDIHDHLAVLITYTYDSAGVVDTRTLQSYDRLGRPLRKEVYLADEYLIYTEENRYDRHGNRHRCIQTTYDEEGRPTRNSYRYKYAKNADGTWRLVSIHYKDEVVNVGE